LKNLSGAFISFLLLLLPISSFAAIPDAVLAKARQGNSAAQYRVAESYARGEGVAKDYPVAAKWYRRAAEQGYGPAQDGLGFLYDQGLGIAVDYKQAAMWWRKAADQGIATAQFCLGTLYDQGLGVARDYSQAYFWLTLSYVANKTGRGEITEYRNNVAKHLTREEIAAIRKRAREWKPVLAPNR
jgi:TPR repeat protein